MKIFSIITFLLVSLSLHQAFSKKHQHNHSINGIDTKLLDRDIGLTPGFGEQGVQWGYAGGTGKEALSNQLVRQALGMIHCFHYIDAVRSARQAIRENPQNPYARIISLFAHPKFSSSPETMKIVTGDLSALASMNLDPQQTVWLNFAKSWLKKKNMLDKEFDRNVAPLAASYESLKVTLTGSGRIEALTFGAWLAGDYGTETYKSALEINPTHIGANHYLTHIGEMNGDHDASLVYSKQMAESAPMSAHAQHMYGHILPLHGMWQEALVMFDKADKIHLDWAKANQFPPDYDWHYAHNNHLLGIVHLALKNYEQAEVFLKLGCHADARSCVSYYDLASVAKDEAGLKNAHEMAVAANPNYASFFEEKYKVHVAEISFLTGQTDAALFVKELKSNSRREFVEKTALSLASAAEQIEKDPSRKAEIIEEQWQQLSTLIKGQFSRGGFDSWTSGLPNVLRVRNLAGALGLTELQEDIDKLVKELINV